MDIKASKFTKCAWAVAFTAVAVALVFPAVADIVSRVAGISVTVGIILITRDNIKPRKKDRS